MGQFEIDLVGAARYKSRFVQQFSLFIRIGGLVLACTSELCSGAPVLSALPLRTAVFTPEIYLHQGAVLRDQGNFFSAEKGTEKDRPVWLLGGDSLSTGWANGSSLRERLLTVDDDVAITESIAGNRRLDVMRNGPVADWTWYAGQKIQDNVLTNLDQLSGQPWVILASALAGIYMTPLPNISFREDPLAMMESVQVPARVRLVTFSLGSNDLCTDHDPNGPQKDLALRLEKLQKTLGSQATYAIWDLPDYAAYRDLIQSRLAQLPASTARDRMMQYCKVQWDVHQCPAAKKPETEVRRQQTREILRAQFGELFFPDTTPFDLLDIVAGDCFHFSRTFHAEVAEQFFAFIMKKGKLSSR